MPVLDWLIPIIIIVALALAVLAKATGETLGEILNDIKEFFVGKAEDVQENTMGVYER